MGFLVFRDYSWSDLNEFWNSKRCTSSHRQSTVTIFSENNWFLITWSSNSVKTGSQVILYHFKMMRKYICINLENHDSMVDVWLGSTKNSDLKRITVMCQKQKKHEKIRSLCLEFSSDDDNDNVAGKSFFRLVLITKNQF